jgi:hypothetical protein
VEFDKEKFKRLVHYVVWRTTKRAGFGATKLNRVLWFAEARAYMLHGKPIAGATYIREKNGPVPRAMMPIRDELVREGKITIKNDRFHNRHITYFESRVRPNMDGFSEEELKIVDWWITHIDEDHTAATISEQSHDYAWEIAKMGEVVPYQAAFAERIRRPTGKQLEWARAQARRRGLF